MVLKRFLSSSVASVLLVQSLLPVGMSSSAWAYNSDDEEEIYIASLSKKEGKKPVAQGSAFSNINTRDESQKDQKASTSRLDRGVQHSTLTDLPLEILDHIRAYSSDPAQILYQLGCLNRDMLAYSLTMLEDTYPESFFKSWATWRFTNKDKEQAINPTDSVGRAVRFMSGIGNVALDVFLSLPHKKRLDRASAEHQQAKSLLKLIPTSDTNKQEKHYLHALLFNTPLDPNTTSLYFCHDVIPQEERMNPNARNMHGVWLTHRGPTINKNDISLVAQALKKVTKEDGASKFSYTQGINEIAVHLSRKLKEDPSRNFASLALYINLLEESVPLGYIYPAYIYPPIIGLNLLHVKEPEISGARKILNAIPWFFEDNKKDITLKAIRSIDPKAVGYNVAKERLLERQAFIQTSKAKASNTVEDWQRAVEAYQLYIKLLEDTVQHIPQAKEILLEPLDQLAKAYTGKAQISNTVEDWQKAVKVQQDCIELLPQGDTALEAKLLLSDRISSLSNACYAKAQVSSTVEDWQQAVETQHLLINLLQETDQNTTQAEEVLAIRVGSLADAYTKKAFGSNTVEDWQQAVEAGQRLFDLLEDMKQDSAEIKRILEECNAQLKKASTSLS